MKKFFALALALVMALSVFAGCSNEQKSQSQWIDAYWKFESDYANDGATEVLKVATSPDFAPMEFMDTDKNKPVGFDILLAMYIAKSLNMKLELELLDFGACQVAVETGAVDCSLAGYSVTDERKENCNLSDYYIAGKNETDQTIIVKAEDAGKYTKAEDFSGKKIAAQGASLQLNLCGEQLPKDCTIDVYVDVNTAVQALLSGMVDGVAVAKGNGEAIMASNKNVAMSGFLFQVDPEQQNNVVMLQKGNDELTQKINAILAECLEKNLYDAWYEASKALANIPSSKEISFDEEGNPIVSESTADAEGTADASEQ